MSIATSPLDTAYNRLDEAHRAWHGALNGYHKIGDFRANINTAIQAIRNLTFALQKQKDNLPNFDSWYESWRLKMSENEILKTLNSARIIIVHQEDLKLKSIAIARTKGWIDFEKMAFAFDPISDSYEIAKGFYDVYAKFLPVAEQVKKRLVFEFERKWVYEKLPDYELLEAITIAYNFFYEMLKDASDKFSIPQRANHTLSFCSNKFNNEGKLKCMIITRQERCLTLNFENGEIIKTQVETISRNEMDFKKVQEKYGDDWKSEDTVSLLNGIFPEEYPFNTMKGFAQVAISALKKDKYLVPISFIFNKDPKTTPVIVAHPFTDQKSKLLAIDEVATKIIKNNGKFVLTMAEVWIYNIDDRGEPFIPSEGNTKGTKEVIQISCLSAEKLKTVTIPFHKNVFKKIIFSKPQVEDFSTDINEHNYYILLPLIKALKQVSS